MALKITQKLSKELISREMGISVKGLEKVTVRGAAFAYQLQMGSLLITVENDLYTHAGRYALLISDPIGGNKVTMLFHPETLNRDFGAEDAEKSDAAQQTRREWVQSNGPDYCHKMVDTYWLKS